MKLTRVTITGADESVEPVDLCRLYDEFPFVEFGILLSESREGIEPRYPSGEWIDHLMECTIDRFPLAGHLCGQWCRDAADGPFLWAIERYWQFNRFQRLQLNGVPWAVNRLALYTSHFDAKEFILQCRDLSMVIKGVIQPALLLDLSGGRGVELKEFPKPHPYAPCGYAGGFGPHNLESVLTTLTAMTTDKDFWVDMESSVRSDVDSEGDGKLFDLAKVRRCLEIAKPFVEEKR